MSRLGIVLLAAGESKRMGSPKQLRVFEGKTLLEWTTERLLKCEAACTVVVLGAFAERMLPLVARPELSVVENGDWASGMASSIRAGVSFAIDQDVDHVMIALVDQPFITEVDYKALVDASQRHPEQVVSAFYDGHFGAPMIFPKRYFADLLALEGDAGARKIVRGLEDVIRVEMNGADLDF